MYLFYTNHQLFPKLFLSTVFPTWTDATLGGRHKKHISHFYTVFFYSHFFSASQVALWQTHFVTLHPKAEIPQCKNHLKWPMNILKKCKRTKSSLRSHRFPKKTKFFMLKIYRLFKKKLYNIRWVYILNRTFLLKLHILVFWVYFILFWHI